MFILCFYKFILGKNISHSPFTIFLYCVSVIDVVFVAKVVSGVIVVAVKQFASVWLANRLLLGVLPPTVELKFLKIS